MGAAALFSGNFVKLLKNKLNLFDTAYILTGTADPRVSATDAPKGSLLMRQNGAGDGQLFLKLDAGNTVNWVLIPGTNLTGDQNEVKDRIQDQLDASFYQFAHFNVARLDAATKINAGASTATYDLANESFTFAAGAADLLGASLLDAEFITYGKDLDDAEVVLHYKDGFIDSAPTAFISRAAADAESDFYPVALERVGLSNVWVGRKQWLDDFKYVANAVSPGGVTTFSALTNAAGVIESVATRLNLVINDPESIYIDKLRVTLTATGTWTAGQGAFRISLYSSLLSTAPQTLLASSPWTNVADVNVGSDEDFTYDIPSKFIYNQAAEGTKYFYAVIETDDAYKATYTATTKELRVRRDSTPGLSYLLDGTTWSAAAGNFNTFAEYHKNYMAALVTYATGVTTDQLNLTTRQKISMPIAIAGGTTGPYMVAKVRAQINRTGSPTGGVYLQIVRASGSFPSTNADDVVATSQIVYPGVGGNVYYFDFGNTVLPPNQSYHFVLSATADYASTFNAGTTFYGWNRNTVVTQNGSWFNGTTWSAATGPTAEYDMRVYGRELTSRFRVVSSMASRLAGYGVIYDREATAVLNAPIPGRQVFHFTNTNPDTFPITVFKPHPDFVKCYYVQAGQVIMPPAFTLRGNSAVFPANTFSAIADPVTLIFEQQETGAYDYSDLNALLMAENHLGSTDTQVDRSAPGRGILLRRPDGTLREVALNNNDELEIYSV